MLAQTYPQPPNRWCRVGFELVENPYRDSGAATTLPRYAFSTSSLWLEVHPERLPWQAVEGLEGYSGQTDLKV
ncbi:hypothetical protein SPHINGOAX6_40058 [Sphingomonas sp. AX6]|nr:hypothetical protein SPHINGOAX6_40058 [Sphingomonas sp. AX6]